MVDNDGEAINTNEIINEFKKPSTFKASSDLATVTEQMKNAMQDIGFNLKHVTDNPWSSRIAQL